MLPVNYAKAAELGKVEGMFAENAVAEVELNGSNTAPKTTTYFLAREVEAKWEQ